MSENITETVETETPANKPRRSSWGTFGILLGAFAILILLSAFYLAYFRLSSSITHLAAALKHLDAGVNDLQKNVNEMQLRSQQFSTDMQAQAQTINTLRQAQLGNQDNWRMTEAQYWVKLANNYLQFENNLPLALSLLQTADKEISEINNGKTASVRKALAQDMTNLQSAPRADLIGWYARLSALNSVVDKLPLQINQTKPTEEPTTQETLPWWKRGLQQTWQALRQIVVVRYNKPGTVALVTPDQQMLLYQNLHATLERAMWAVIHKQPEIYRASLQQASAWVKLYFVQDAPITQSFLNTLNELEQLDINPTLPTLTASLQAFDDYFKQAQGVS